VTAAANAAAAALVAAAATPLAQRSLIANLEHPLTIYHVPHFEMLSRQCKFVREQW
jgi:hypothetical protein